MKDIVAIYTIQDIERGQVEKSVLVVGARMKEGNLE
jgi:hypothetical protein